MKCLLRYCLFLVLSFVSVNSQTWVSRATLENSVDFYRRVMQQTVQQIEANDWSNLRTVPFTRTLNEQMYNWHVLGNVTYTNGFVVSIQKLELVNVQDLFTTAIVNGTAQTTASVRGILNLRDMKIGLDVLVDLENEAQQQYTGVYTHTLTQLQCSIMKNLNTHVITTDTSEVSLSRGVDNMFYMPSNRVTEVLSRRFSPSDIFDSLSVWARQVINPILLDIATNQIEFPKVCFVSC